MRNTPIVFLCALLLVSCDSKEEKPVALGEAQPSTAQNPSGGGEPQETDPVASPAHRPLPPGTSFRAQLDAHAVIPTEPSRKMRKKTGSFRPIPIETNIKATFSAERMSTKDEEATDRWKFSFDTFEQTTSSPAIDKATSDLQLPDRTLVASIYDQNTTVLNPDESTATDSQTDIAAALAAELSKWDQWGKFLAGREFPRGNIIAGPEGLPFGSFAEAKFGLIVEANATVAMFRFALVDENEVVIFEIHSQMKAEEERGSKKVYWDIKQQGKITVRVVDGFLLDYSLEAKAIPREKTGAMLTSGSGTWKVDYSVSPDSITLPE